MKLSEAEELLPWFVAGTLSDEETRLVQAFMDSGAIPREKIDELGALAVAVDTEVEDEPEYNPAILRNVMSQLDGIVQDKSVQEAHVHEKSAQQNLSRAVAKTGTELNLFERVASLVQWSLTPSWAKMTMAVQFSLLVAAVVVFSTSYDGSQSDGGFNTASGNNPGDLTVAFNPSASEADVRALLQQYGANIVAGPTALGIYTIDLADDVDIATVQAELQANSLTTIVQPVLK